MSAEGPRTSSVRASRDGHEFHETWVARRALELIYPRDDLCAIAIEGLSPLEDRDVAENADEIADLVLYYGEGPSFEEAGRLEVLQFKYSISRANKGATASDVGETIRKFAQADASYASTYGAEAVSGRVFYRFVTNRPVAASLMRGIEALRTGAAGATAGRNAASALLDASGLSLGDGARDFFSRLSLQGGTQDLAALKGNLRRTLASWTPSSADLEARARLGELRQLVRDKAGSAGAGDNLIGRVDVLGNLGVQHEKDLLPAEARFAPTESIIHRAEVESLVETVRTAGPPIVVHADGGVGKTVFLQDTANRLSDEFEVVLFDCFGGGAYRSIEDGRHLPRVGLMHLINMLASRGLCDPVLPSIGGDAREMFRVTRSRLEKVVESIREVTTKRGVVLILDAIDNAAQQALDRHDPSFPRLLLESLSAEPIDGVHVIASCRSHRREFAVGSTPVTEVHLEPFDEEAIHAFVEARVSDATDSEIAIAKARSQGNARVLSYLVENWRDLIRDSEVQTTLPVQEVIAHLVSEATKAMTEKEGSASKTSEFLAALALLPPPIPVDEFAAALGIGEGAIRSFASDLAPLLDQTPLGIIFRDEPTETYIRENYSADDATVKGLTERLGAAQRTSAYAARVLPRLFQIMRDVSTAYGLALSDDYPSEIVSELGRRRLRLARLRAAVTLAAEAGEPDRLVGLLMELGRTEAANSRGDDYIAEAPDLVVAANDAESLRRLFENRSGWPGARHARLATAYCMDGEHEEALRHARRLDEWIVWFFTSKSEREQSRDDSPKDFEVAAIPFYLISVRRFEDAVDYFDHWRPEFGYAVACRAIDCVELRDNLGGENLLSEFNAHLIKTRSQSIPILTALTREFVPVAAKERRRVLQLLAKACDDDGAVEEQGQRLETSKLNWALLRAAVTSVVLGMRSTARRILKAAGIGRAGVYSYTSDYGVLKLAPHIIASCLRRWCQGEHVRLSDLLPSELATMRRLWSVTDVRELKALLEAPAPSGRRKNKDDKGRRVDLRDVPAVCEVVERALRLASAAETWVLKGRGVQSTDANSAISALRENWGEHLSRYDRLLEGLAGTLGAELAWTAVRSLSAPDRSVIESYMDAVESVRSPAMPPARCIRYLARVSEYQEFAGQLAIKAAEDVTSNEYIESRAREFTELARAIAPASRADAATYFLRGLHQLDTIGAGDFDVLSELLSYAAKQSGGPIAADLAERLMNLCELNFSQEPSKFPWAWFARAAANSIGPLALCKAIRWHDRDVAPLDYSLPPLACALARSGHLSAREATALFLLVECESWWEWKVGDGLKELLDRSEPAWREAIVRLIIERVRDDEADRGWPGLWASLSQTLNARSDLSCDAYTVVLANLEKESAVRVEETNRRANSHSGRDFGSLQARTAYERREEDARAGVREIAARVAVTDAASIDQALAELEALDAIPMNRFELFFSILRERTKTTERYDHITALIDGQDKCLLWRLEAIEHCIAAWDATSAFIAEKRAEFADRLLDRQGCELFNDDFGISSKIHKIASISGLSVEDIIVDVVRAACGDGAVLQGKDWLYLAACMSARASPAAAREALERVLRSESAALADQTGEGPHRESAAPPRGSMELTTRVLWHRLGDPDSFARWRAARSVEVLAELGLGDHLDALCRLKNEGTHPSLVTKLRFAKLNSKQWLLIGQSHAALRLSEPVRQVSAHLREVLEDVDAHVLFRVLAGRGLIALERSRPAPDAARMKELCHRSLNTPRKVAREELRSKPDADEDDRRLRLEYEFEKYELAALQRLFGLGQGAAKRAVVDKVLSLDPDATDDIVGYYRYRRSERFETYGDQLLRHAALLVATDLAETHPVVDPGYSDEPDFDPWAEWLARYDLTRTDGYWLADGTDRRPKIADCFVYERQAGKDIPPATPEKVAEAAGLVSPRPGENVPLSGSWRSEDEVGVQLSSALVDRYGAIAKCRRLAQADRHHLWLPQLDHDGLPHERTDAKRHPEFRPWIWKRQPRLGIDRLDALASGAAHQRTRLGPDVTEEEGLTTSDLFARSWVDRSGAVVLSSLAWRVRGGRGEEERDHECDVLLASSEWLLAYLKRKDLCLACVVSLSKYISHYDGHGGKFVDAKAIALLNADGELRFWKVKHVSDNGDGA